MGLFKPIPEVVPEGSVGVAKVEHIDVKQSFFTLREGVSPGRYAQLYIKGRLYMSDTSMEHRTNYEVVRHAHGHVLIAGLGLGMILTAILDKPEVTAVTVVEKFQDVIDLVAPHHTHPKLKVVCADIFEWRPLVGCVFDVVYFDIWPDLCVDNLKEMSQLHRRFAHWMNRANPRRWMGSWCQGALQAQRDRDAKERKRRLW